MHSYNLCYHHGFGFKKKTFSLRKTRIFQQEFLVDNGFCFGTSSFDTEKQFLMWSFILADRNHGKEYFLSNII